MASGMTDLQRKRWEENKIHADRVWERQGLARSSGSGSESRGKLDVLDYIRAYRGDQWDGDWGGIPEEDLAVSPLFFSAVNTHQSQNLARTPKILVQPRRMSQASGARLAQAVYNYDAYELKFKRQWDACNRAAFFGPFAIMRHGFTPEEEHTRIVRNKERTMERYAHARSDKPWMMNWKVWDFRSDPLAVTPDSDGTGTWCAFRSLAMKDEINENPAMTLPRDAQPTVSLEIRNEQTARRFQQRRHPQAKDFFEIWTYYENRERTWFQMTADHKIVRQPDDWPIPWEDLPYDALYFNPQEDSMFPLAYAEVILPIVREHNKARTLFMELVKRMRRMVVFNKHAIDDSDWHKIVDADLMEAIGVNGNLAQAFAQIPVGGFDQSILLLDQLYERDVRMALGQSDLDRGQRINVESAQEAAAVQRGSNIQTARNQEAIEDFTASTIRHYAQARRATMSEDEVIPILGREDTSFLLGEEVESQFLNVTKKDLAGEYDYQIRVGSTLPRNEAQEAQEALQDLQVAGGSPDLHDMAEMYRRYWQARRIDPSKVMLGKDELEATLANQPPTEEAQGGTDLAPLLQALPRFS